MSSSAATGTDIGTNAATNAVHEALFGDVLSCDELRPAIFLPGPVDEAGLHRCNLRAESLLRALAVIEDGRSDEPEEATDYALQRIEAKLDLLTTLVASLCRSDRDNATRLLTWSARGACLPVAAAAAVGSSGWLKWQPVDWLPESLSLPATVLACESIDGVQAGARLWLGFGPLSPALEAALERHLFRVHRRAIAESRRPR